MTAKVRTIRTARSAAASAEDPITTLMRRRRAFFEPLLVRVSAMPSDQSLPRDMIQEILLFARAHNSDFALVQMVDGTAGDARRLLEELLSLPNLQSTTLSSVIPRFLQDLREQEMAAAYGDKATDTKEKTPDEKILSTLRQYVQKNLTAYLPTLPADQKRVDVPLEKLEEDLARLYPIENLFYSLFHANILLPETIKEFLATSDFMVGDKLNVRRAIHDFIRAHYFDRVHQVLAEHKIDGPGSWETFLTKEYMGQFPPQLWRLTKREQFETLQEELQKTSIPMVGLIDRLLQRPEKKNTDFKKKTSTTTKLAPANLMRIKNTGEIEIFHRTRPDIPGFQTLLVRPLENADLYVGVGIGDDGYAIPTDSFYRDLVQKEVEQEGKRLVIRDEDRIRVVNVAYQMKDGRIVPQTREMFLKSQRYMEKKAAEKLVTIPQITRILLDTPLSLLSTRDLEALRKEARESIVHYLTLHSGCRLDQNSAEVMAKSIEEGISSSKEEDVEDYFSRLFHVMVLIDPRYAFHLLSPAIHLRLRLGFYQPAEITHLPTSLIYPDYPGLTASQKADYDKWMAQAMENFCHERIVSFLVHQYPFLRTMSAMKRAHSMPPRALLASHSNTTLRENQSVLVLYHEDIPLFLDVLAASILHQQEFLVEGKTLDPAFLEELQRFLDLERVQYGLSAPEINVVPTIDFHSDSVEDMAEETSLPNFKKTAMDFLDHL